MKRREFQGESCEVYLENPHVVLFWIESIRAVGGVWRQAPLGADWNGLATIQECLDVGLKIIREKQANRWITDSRNMAVMAPEAQRWTTENWWPRALDAGFQWLAIVMPKNVIAKMAIDRSLAPSQGHDTQFFGSLDEAITWLRTKP